MLAAGFWLYTGPQRALRDSKVAADADDVEGIRERVDVPAVKESLKEQFTTMMQQKMATDNDLKDNPFAGPGILFAGKMVETMVDAAVTPAHLAALLKGDRSSAFDKDRAASPKQAGTEPPEGKTDLAGSYNSLTATRCRCSTRPRTSRW